jgi:ElaB/YqjD/DUF883 family membrane-anchored ribosome-binding protein
VTDTPRNSPIDKAAEQARTAADRVAERATDAITSARTSVHQTVNTVAERANAATQWASDKVDAARQAPIDVIEAGAEYIKARPYAAVAVALAMGYLMGRLGRRA